MKRLAISAALSLLALSTCATTPATAAAFTATIRNQTSVNLFKKTHACPATNIIQRSCPGYVVDHKVPLCMGGADTPENMQWQELQESYKKDSLERACCAMMRN